MKHVFMLAVLAGGYSMQVFGQNNQMSVQMDEVVVTGTGTHHRMSSSPVPVTVIPARDLRNASINSLEEALTKLSPAFSFSTNGMGTTMTLNGVQQDYVLVLVNGKKLAGEDTYARINLDNVKRIEVLNGAASALYGSDAIGGVINIITDEPKEAVQADSHTRISSYNRMKESVGLNISQGKWGSYTHYNYLQSGNWQLNPYDEKGLLTGKMNGTGNHSHNLEQKFTFDPSEQWSFYLRGNYYDYSTDRPSDTMSQNAKDPKKFAPAYTYDLHHETFLYGGGAKYRFKKGGYIEAEAYSDNYTGEKVYMGNDKHKAAGETSLDKKIHYTNAQLKGFFQLGEQHRLSVGTEYIHETLNSEKTTSAAPIDAAMYTWAAYAQDEWQINRHWYAVAGVRYIYHENFQSYATPNVSLMYKTGGLNVRASYAGGFRTPELAQLYTMTEANAGKKLILPNLKLKPEKSDYVALNVEYTRSWFSVSVTGYLNQLRDMINYHTFTENEKEQMGYGQYEELRQRQNINKARIAGLNVLASANLGGGFNISAGYAYNDAKNLSADTPVDKSLKHSGNVNARWGKNWKNYRLDINLNGRIQGERYSDLYAPAPAFSLWDFNTRHTFRLRKLTLEPGVGIENILNYRDDRPWNNNFATLTPGRSVYASLIIRFGA